MANKSPLDRDLVFFVIKFLDRVGFEGTARSLEKESGLYFNMKFFKALVMMGAWEEVEWYLGGFTTIEKNELSAKIFFLIRKQKYYEALERGDRAKAAKILLTELKALSKFSPSVYQELTHLLPLEDFRQNKKLGYYKDTMTVRGTVFDEIKKLVEDNPRFRDKLQFPEIRSLRALIEQRFVMGSHGRQQELQNLPLTALNIEALVGDHACQQQPSGQVHSEGLSLIDSIPKTDSVPQLAKEVQEDNQQLALVPTTGVPPRIHTAISVHPANSGAHNLPLTVPNIKALVGDHACQQQPSGPVHSEDLSLVNITPKAVAVSQLAQGVQQDKQQLALVQTAGVPSMTHAAISVNPANSGVHLPLTAPNIKALVGDHACQQQPSGQVHSEDLSLVNVIPKVIAVSQLAQGVARVDNQQLPLVQTTGVPPIAHTAISARPANSVAHLNRPPSSPSGNAKRALKMTRIMVPSNQQNTEPLSSVDVRPRKVIPRKVRPRKVHKPIEESWSSELPETEINGPSECCSLRLPDNLLSMKVSVSGLLYSNCGKFIVALTSDGIHKVWKWEETERNTSGKATVSLPPQFFQPPNGIRMTNEMSDINTEEVVHSFTISKNGSYIVSTSGGKISIFNTVNFKTMMSFMEPPPKVTCLAFDPLDNNVLAIGMDDSSIQIYSLCSATCRVRLSGHQKRITGLAFSCAIGVLISTGSDGQLCKWKVTKWVKLDSKLLTVGSGRVPGPLVGTRVEFHDNQFDFLVVNEIQLAIYCARLLECNHQLLMPQDEIVTSATYSCDGKMVYASFMDGSVRVYTGALRPRCRINTITILSTQPSLRVYPVAVAAHPSEPNQFALGLTDGSVVAFEPLESEGKWGTPPYPKLYRE